MDARGGHGVRDVAALRARVESLAPWFHNLHLPGGVQTAPDQPYGDFPRFKWRQIADHVPQDLRGWRVLDIGCNAGFYSFELARRGASVVAIDMEPHYLRQARWVAQVFGLSDAIEFRCVQLYRLLREDAQYDLVWFMGVLYHLRHPLLALDLLRRRTRRLLLLQTLSLPEPAVIAPPQDLLLTERARLSDAGWPRMAFIERRMAGDPSNWWLPNRAAVEAMLRSAGFGAIAQVADETYRCEPVPWPDDDHAARVAGELEAATGCAAR